MGPNILIIPCLLAMAKALSTGPQIFASNQQEVADSSCFWSGTAPFCAGFCESPYEDCGTSSCGDGACCWTGYKKYCCRGGCPDSALKVKVEKTLAPPEMPGLTLDGHNNDICDSETEFLWCPLDAKENKQCRCMKLNEVSSSDNQRVLKGGEQGDL